MEPSGIGAEDVALWIGLLGGLISIVLAIVAMVFTFAVDRRSTSVNEQVIQSLQKIESTVEGVAGDTRDLIKVAFDRMLPRGEGAVDDGDAVLRAQDDEAVRAIAAGVAAELRADLGPSGPDQPDRLAVERLDSAVDRIERTLQAQLSTSTSGRTTAERLDALMRRVADLSPPAREVMRVMIEVGRHLTRQQFMELRQTPTGEAVQELRRASVIGPLRSRAEGTDEPVYYFAPSTSEYVPAVVALQSAATQAVSKTVRDDLRRVGYLPEDE